MLSFSQEIINIFIVQLRVNSIFRVACIDKTIGWQVVAWSLNFPLH